MNEHELRDAIRELEAGADGRQFTQEERDQWNALNEQLDEYVVRRERVLELAGNPHAREDGTRFHTRIRTDDDDATPKHVREARDAGLRAIERVSPDMKTEAVDRLDVALRLNDPMGLGARYVAAVADPHYASAFMKILAHPMDAQYRMSREEVESVRRVTEAEEQRAMSVGTTTAGGFGIPILIDPTLTLVGSGALCPVRDYARVETITSDTLRLVATDGVTAAYAAEATEASDNSPVLAQPVVDTAKGQAFVPFSIEVGMDYPNLVSELGRLLADARAVVDATQLLTGSGTNAPKGVLTALAAPGNQLRVQTATTAVTAIADVYSLKGALASTRWFANAVFAAHPSVWDVVYRFTGGNSAEPLLMADRAGPVIGVPKFEWSTMSTGTTTTGQKIMLMGDFSQFVIADRIGAQIEVVPHLFGGSQRPTGQRGLYFYWRTGSDLMVSATPNAGLRWLEVK